MLRLVILALLACGTLSMVRYDNFKVYEVSARNLAEREAIRKLEEQITLDVWREGGPDIPAHISVAPDHQMEFMTRLTDLGIEFKVVIENVQNQIDEVDAEMARIPKAARNIENTYYTYDQNVAFLEGLKADYGDRLSVVNFGKSRYNRDLFYVKLSSDRFSSEKPEDSVKPVIWMESTTHAREWITNACILNLINWLLSQYGTDSNAIEMLDKYDWFIVPIQNPDGYSYSHTNDRMWRKTRTTGSCSSWQGQGNGVDPNRNWAYGWGINGQTNRCAADYQGPNAFSEPATKGMSDQMIKTPKALRKAFLSLHSYSQLILTPYGYDRYATVPNYSEQLRVANAARDAILATSGKNFRVGKPGELLYNAPGGAYDYALGELGFTYSLTYELHPTGSPGFQLPPSNIKASFADFLASIIAITKNLQ